MRRPIFAPSSAYDEQRKRPTVLLAEIFLERAVSTEDAMSNESLLTILLVGLIAGWLAGLILRGAGFGIISDLIIGILGAFIGDWLLPRLGLHLGSGIVPAIVNATIGAILLLLVIRLVRGGGGGWGRRW
jgi:uncharacterized membrane protein YeaQ/YmgE (transglycosylase-associated protein family)